jgi:hypothetical protein
MGRPPRVLLSLALTTGCICILTGCGGGGGQTAIPGGGPTKNVTALRHSLLAFADCMRSHGASGYPDPQISTGGGHVQVRISPGNVNENAPAVKSAQAICRHLLPNGGQPGSVPAQQRPQELKFAQCMRGHGVANFPDPGHDGAFDLPSGLSTQSPQFQRAMAACSKVRPSQFLISQRGNGA